jgi:hypothetical protein
MASKSEDVTIAKMVSLPRLKVFDAELSAYEEANPYMNAFPVVDKNTYLGIEVEVENVQTYRRASPYWTVKEDGSLRNHGREFVTPPIRAWRVEHALYKLFNNELNSDIDFSERTSIHVHMNIRTLTIKQLEALVLTYIVFEKVLFNYVGEDRYNNIFCVPIVETDIGYSFRDLISQSNPNTAWQKYTALNLLPIMQLGTIEFRHLGGTSDIETLMTWINMLLSLKKFALQKDPEYIWNRIQTLNTTSEYRIFGEEVFGNLIQDLWNLDYNENMSECITYIKQFCLKNEFLAELYQKSQNEFNLHTWTIRDEAMMIREDEEFHFEPTVQATLARLRADQANTLGQWANIPIPRVVPRNPDPLLEDI